MTTKSVARISGYLAACAIGAVFLALSGGTTEAQAIRCENLMFAQERIACYYYRASLYPGQSCLFCAPQVQQPVRRIKKKRRAQR